RSPRGTGPAPAVLEKDNPGHRSRILPAAEALIYPAYWQSCLSDDPDLTDYFAAAMRSPLIDTLRRHSIALLTDPERRNLFADGGIKLSSTSNNSWMSKIAIVQHVARKVLRLDLYDPRVTSIFATADAAHVRWQTEGGGYWACSDQFVKGIAKASRYYPRLITAALWLDGAPAFTPPQDAKSLPTPQVT